MSFITDSFIQNEVLVRDKYLFDNDSKEYSQGYIVGISAIPQVAPMFQVMLDNGAMWAHLPLHSLAWKECEELSITELCWWDSFSDTFSVFKFDMLKGYKCSAKSRSKKIYDGEYLCTIDWKGRWADIPDQHKQHHFIKLENGNFGMYPNNKLYWKDESWIKGTIPKDYKVISRYYSCEDEKGIDNLDVRDY